MLTRVSSDMILPYMKQHLRILFWAYAVITVLRFHSCSWEGNSRGETSGKSAPFSWLESIDLSDQGRLHMNSVSQRFPPSLARNAPPELKNFSTKQNAYSTAPAWS